MSWTLLDFYVANGAVLLPGFDDPHDGPARETLARLFPGREVVQVPLTGARPHGRRPPLHDAAAALDVGPTGREDRRAVDGQPVRHAPWTDLATSWQTLAISARSSQR